MGSSRNARIPASRCLSGFRQWTAAFLMVSPRSTGKHALLGPPVDVDALLANSPIFGLLPESARARLAAVSRLESYDCKTLLNAADQPLVWLRLVLHGAIEITARSAAGEEAALIDVGPGGWVTWVACFAEQAPEHDFVSSAQLRCLALPTSAVRQAAQQHPQIFPPIIEAIGVRLRLLMEWTGQSVMLAPEQRMARLLHVLARANGSVEGNRASLLSTQQALARLARCSRQSANTLLRNLERRQLLRVSYGRYDIDDMAALAAFTEQVLD